MREKNIRIEVFLGLIASGCRVRLTAEPTGGKFKLPGGEAKERKNLDKLLSLKGLFKEGASLTEEETGIKVISPEKYNFSIFKIETETKEEERYAFLITVLSSKYPTRIFDESWDEDAQAKGVVKDFDPWDLVDDRNLLGKITYKMALVALHEIGDKVAEALLEKEDKDWWESGMLWPSEKVEKYLSELRNNAEKLPKF